MEEKSDSVVLPELLGPIFKSENITFRQALCDNNASRRLSHLGTFVPDELIYLIDNRVKYVDYDFAILYLLDFSSLYALFDKFSNCQNSGSVGLSTTFNLCTSTVIELIIVQGGDIINISDSGILAIWKKEDKKEPTSKIMKNVVSCCLAVLEILEGLEHDYVEISKVVKSSALSAGSVTLMTIGDSHVRHYVLVGEAMTDVTEAVKVKSKYLLLTQNAWKHCSPSDYSYTEEEKNYIKIMGETGKQKAVTFAMTQRNMTYICKPMVKIPECITRKHFYYREVSNAVAALSRSKYKQRTCVAILRDCETEQKIITIRQRILKNCKTEIGNLLKTFIILPVLKQIEQDLPLQFLAEMKEVTVVMIKILPVNNDELIPLADKCHHVILTHCEDIGWIESVTLNNSTIVFRVIFGIRTYLHIFNHCRFGLLYAWKLFNILKHVENLSNVNIAVTTGMVSCTVVGYVARRQYTFIGSAITRAESILSIAHNKLLCDTNTLIHSKLKRRNFPASTLITVDDCVKGYVFVYSDEEETGESGSDLSTAYPILGRFEELELFSRILSYLGASNRPFAGIIIEGATRSGKSRLLDAFSVIAHDRDLEVMRVGLQASYALKPYTAIHKIFEQILNTDHCKTVVELERKIVKKLGHIIAAHEFCYLNKIMKVQFKLSKDYIVDTDWNRHHKTVMIFHKILMMHNKNTCILIDDVHYMDYMSWIFFTHMLNHKNVILGMTILQMQAWQVLSRVESDICKNKRFLRKELPGLKPKYFSTLICQFLGVQAISVELHDFLIKMETTNPGWFELFLTLMNVCEGFDILTVTSSEIDKYKLIFPDPILTSRLPVDLFPDEVAPMNSWSMSEQITICLINENFQIAPTFMELDIQGLALEIFDRLTENQQEIIKCASVIGKAFVRSILEMIIVDIEPSKTSEELESLMKLRIIECASLQRKMTRIGDLVIQSPKPRSTFSDMHHQMRCYCASGPNAPGVDDLAHCQFMEFKTSGFQHEIYEEIPEMERKLVHRHLVEIYKRVAKKCVACGGGNFLKIPGKEKHKSSKAIQATTSTVRPPLEEASPKASNENISDKGAILEHPELRTSDQMDPGHFTNENYRNTRRTSWKLFQSNNKVHPSTSNDIDLKALRCQFGHNDHRNCRCLRVIDCIFRKLDQHLDYSDNYRKSISLSLQYASALTQHGQPGHALRLLVAADRKHDFVSTYNAWQNPGLMKKIITKSLILRLKGDAYMLLGNYPQAKSNYAEALSLYHLNFSSSGSMTGSKIMFEKLKQNLFWKLSHPDVVKGDLKKHKKKIYYKQNAASCLSLISEVLLFNNRLKPAKLASIQSMALGFLSFEPRNFHNQCQLFLMFVKVYGSLGKLSFLRLIEQYILYAIHEKQDWTNCEDIIMVMNVYTSIYKVSWLRGILGRAVHFGERALSISKAFYIVRIQYELLVSLVQTLIRLKRVCETVDVLQQLRDYATEDIDKSATTWYYALCMDLLLDAGLQVESFYSCSVYARKVILGETDHCVVRDCRGLKRLLVGLWTWQLRKGDLTTSMFIRGLEYFTNEMSNSDCSQVITLCKLLECHLMLLTKCINMKKCSEVEILLADIKTLMNMLEGITKIVQFIKPHFLLLKAYYSQIFGRVDLMKSYVREAEKIAETQMNVMTLAWILRNKISWEAVSFNNMARYWEENIGYENSIAWQDVDTFDLDDWSNVLYPLPIPDSFM